MYRGKVLGSIGLLASLFLGGLFCTYVFVFSYWLPAPTVTSLTLTEAPDVTLVDHTGREVQIGDLRGRNALLVFYRGHW